MRCDLKLFFSIFFVITFLIGPLTIVSYSKVNLNYNNNNTNTKAEIRSENSTIDNNPFLFYAMGPNGQLPKEMKYAVPPELHPSPTGNTILIVDTFDTYKTETEFIASPWDFYEPSNTHCNLKEDKTLAVSGKRVVEFYDNNISSYTHMFRSFSAVNQYLYVKISLYAEQTNRGGLFVWLDGPGGSSYIKMGQNSNSWYYGSNGAEISTGSTYAADNWYTVELFANILKNTFDFYVDNDCKASNVSFFDTGVTSLNRINVLTTTSETSSPLTYYIDSLEISIPPKIICLLVKFSDEANSNTVNTMYQKIFTNDGSFRNYYKENSYNKFTVAGTVTPWIMMPQTMVYYGRDGADTDDYYGDPEKIAEDAVNAANSIVDFSIYDHVIVFHAGDDQAGSGVGNDIWSMCVSYYYPYGPVDGVYFDHLCWVSEIEGIGGACHEFGHMLDLPDLYNYNPPPTSFVGDWCLMDSGSWNNGGNTPAHMTAWCKMKLGWLSSENIEIIETTDWDNGAYLYPLELSSTNKQVIKIEIDTNHYYLVENRLQTGFDAYIPDNGIIITYVDETLGSGAGKVKVKNSHPGSTNLDEAAWDLTGDTEWQVFRDLLRKIYVTIGPKSGNAYFLYDDRYSSTNRTYEIFNVPPGDYIYYDFVMTAGEILVWDWFATNIMDFVIERLSDGARFEQVLNINHDGGILRAPTSATYQLRVRNAYSSSRTLQIDVIQFTAPTLNIYEFISLDSPIYRTNQFTLRLQVRNTGGSLVEGVTATLNLPSGLSLDDASEQIVSIDDLGYYEYATVYWEVYAGSAGTKSVQVVMASTWGGAPTQNLTINILLDTIPPTLSILTPSNQSIRTNNDVSVSWSVVESQTSLKTITIRLNEMFITNTTSSSYDFIDLPDGLYYCKIIAYDIENNAAQKLIIFRIDTKKPSIAKIAAPIALRWYAGQIQIVANAYDNGSGVANVRFYMGNPASGGTLLGTDNSPIGGWTFNWMTNSGHNGQKEIFIRVYDNAGWYNDSVGVTIYIDNSPPTNLNCLSLQNYGLYKGKIPIQVGVQDTLSGIRNVEFWVGIPGSGGILLYNDSSSLDGWNYTWSTTQGDDGTQIIYIRVYDNCKNVNTLSITIYIDNSPPINLICTSLENYGTYEGKIPIQITGEDPVSGIRNVEFWLGIPGSGGILLYNDTSSTDGWKYTWSTTKEDNGNHTIYLRVYDNCGNKNTLSILIYVQNKSSFLLIFIIIGVIAAAAVSSVLIIKHVKKQKTTKKPLILKDMKKGITSPLEPFQQAEPSAAPTRETPLPAPPKPFQQAAPSVAPTRETPSPALPKPFQQATPSVAPTRETPSPAPPKPFYTFKTKYDIKESESLTSLPSSYKCPDCNSLIPDQKIENLKNGISIICTTCSTPIKPELIFHSETRPTQESIAKINTEEIPDNLKEEISKKTNTLSNEEIDKILKVLDFKEPETPQIPEPKPIGPVTGVLPPEPKPIGPVTGVPPPEPKPIGPVTVVPPPVVVKLFCPHCGNPLSLQKITNLEKGIGVLCNNCLKTIQPELIFRK